MARRRRYNLEEDIGISEEQLRQNLQLLPQQARPSKGYRVLHGINVFLRIVILILILILLFRIQKTDVQGNENITDEQIMTWIGEDKKALNSLYAIYKYNVRQEERSPAPGFRFVSPGMSRSKSRNSPLSVWWRTKEAATHLTETA